MADYPIVILPLRAEEGGGFLGLVPDLVGCMSDGETHEEVLQNTTEAIRDWLAECDRLGREVPEPGRAMRRAKDERRKLLDAIKGLADICDHQDRRIEQLVQALEDLRDRSAHDLPWDRLLEVFSSGQRGPVKLALVNH